MMIPSLPTDNLYKFIAMTGLLMVIFYIIFPSQKLVELTIKKIDVETEVAVISNEIEQISDDVKHIEKIANQQGHVTAAQLDELENRNNEARNKNRRMEGELKKIQVLAIQHKTLESITKPLFPLGLFLMAVGFLCWYLLVQRPTDALLRKEKKTAR
jgi:hypothetical protein